MKYIANILTDEPFSGGDLYNVTTERSFLIPEIPTLIIGWEKTKAEYPGTSIIEWEVADDVYWTYGKYEKREKYEENLKKFNDFCIKKFTESVKYVFYDVITQGDQKFSSFLSTLANGDEKVVYVVDDMIYLYMCQSDKVVIGTSLRDCEYVYPDCKKKVFSILYSTESVTVIKNNDMISREIRYKMKGKEYILPYLFS